MPSAIIMRNERTVAAERAVGHRPAMRVDAEGRGNAEIAVRLHHRGRQADLVEMRDHLLPARSAIDAESHGLAVGLAAVDVHRDRDAVARQALPAHGMARRADADRALQRSRLLQFLAEPRDQFGLGCGCDDPVAEHRCRARAGSRRSSRCAAGRRAAGPARATPDAPWPAIILRRVMAVIS